MPAWAYALGLSKPWFDRLLIAHFVAYPIALPWAVAAIPMVIHLRFDELALLTDEAEVSSLILRLVALPTAGVFVLAHAVAIPWIRDARHEATTRRGRMLYLIAAVAIGVLGVVAAAIGWAALLRNE